MAFVLPDPIDLLRGRFPPKSCLSLGELRTVVTDARFRKGIQSLHLRIEQHDFDGCIVEGDVISNGLHERATVAIPATTTTTAPTGSCCRTAMKFIEDILVKQKQFKSLGVDANEVQLNDAKFVGGAGEYRTADPWGKMIKPSHCTQCRNAQRVQGEWLGITCEQLIVFA